MAEIEVKPEIASPDWQQFLDGINRLNENFTDFRRETRQPIEEVEEPEPEAPGLPPLPDFDNMTQSQVANWLMNQFGTTVVERVIAHINQTVAPLQQAHQENRQAVLTEQMTREITQLMNEKDDKGKLVRPDYQDWGPDMIEIVKELPGIQPMDAYQMARNRNPKRAAELDARYNPPPPPPKSPFSFAPGGSGSAGTASTAKPLSSEEAFKTAYQKVKEKWGDQFALGQREF